jgi:hypothetical protein
VAILPEVLPVGKSAGIRHRWTAMGNFDPKAAKAIVKKNLKQDNCA